MPILEQARDNLRRHLGPVNQNVLLADLELVETYWRWTQGRLRNASSQPSKLALRRDHPDNQTVARIVKTTRDDLAKLKAGETLHRRGP